MRLLTFIAFLLPVSLQSQQLFGPEHVVIGEEEHGMQSPTCAKAVDLDGDGDLDIIMGNSQGSTNDKVAWYENRDGAGNFGVQQVISIANRWIQDVHPADLDGDGDPDLIATSLDDQVTWFENLDGKGHFSPVKIISTLVDRGSSVFAADLDGDGDLDVLSASESDNKIAWYENLDGSGNFGSQQIITTQVSYAQRVLSADLDGDGDMDVISGSSTDDKLAWYENTDGQGNFGPQQVISTLAGNPKTTVLIDLDGDGDIDMLSALTDKTISWFKNDGTGVFEVIPINLPQTFSASGLAAGDMDNDGDPDIIAAVGLEDQIVWYENMDGDGNFGDAKLITDAHDNPFFVFVADLDSDLDQDVLFVNNSGVVWDEDKIGWFANSDSQGTLIDFHPVSCRADEASDVFAGDIDQDGDLDLLSVSLEDNKVAWYENEDGQGTFGPQKIISKDASNPVAVHAADLDGDGDLDVLSASFGDNKIAWYENEDGQGHFGPQQVISSQFSNARDVKAADIDGDGDMDVAAVWRSNGFVVWFENMDGVGDFSTNHIISSQADGCTSIELVDLDKDGNLDVLTNFYSEVVWYRNEDGLGNFSTKKTISNQVSYVSSVFAADINGDGWKDVLSTSTTDDKLAWYQNNNGTSFSSQQIVAPIASNPNVVFADDTDGDGDVDVLLGASVNGVVSLFDNLNGAGLFDQELVLAGNFQLGGGSSVITADIDNDGDKDVIYAGSWVNRIAWVENLMNRPALSGAFFFDQNENKIQDPGEPGLFNQSVQVEPSAIARFSASDGSFYLPVLDGDYTLTALPGEQWELTTDIESYSVTVAGQSQTDLDFGLKPLSVVDASKVTLTSGPTRCGFVVPFWLNLENTGTTFHTGMYSLETDPLASVIAFNPAPDSVQGNTLFWKITDLPPTQSSMIRLEIEIPGVASLGDTLTFISKSYRSTPGTIQLADTYSYRPLVNCGFDPNDKLVRPEGVEEEHFTLFGETLEYTIRFQNTGTDTAFTVRIEDYLVYDLDWTSFQPVAASHSCETTLHENGLVEFLFSNIMLPDSNVNKTGSQGFVTFRIRPVEGLPEKTVIRNKAGIYFDFNPPVVTNETHNTLVSELPVGPNSISETAVNPSIQVFPNPFHDQVKVSFSNLPFNEEVILKITGPDGRIVHQDIISPDKSFEFQGKYLPGGICFIQLINGKGELLACEKVLKL